MSDETTTPVEPVFALPAGTTLVPPLPAQHVWVVDLASGRLAGVVNESTGEMLYPAATKKDVPGAVLKAWAAYALAMAGLSLSELEALGE